MVLPRKRRGGMARRKTPAQVAAAKANLAKARMKRKSGGRLKQTSAQRTSRLTKLQAKFRADGESPNTTVPKNATAKQRRVIRRQTTGASMNSAGAKTGASAKERAATRARVKAKAARRKKAKKK